MSVYSRSSPDASEREASLLTARLPGDCEASEGEESNAACGLSAEAASCPPAASQSVSSRCSSLFFSLLSRYPVVSMLLFLLPSALCLLVSVSPVRLVRVSRLHVRPVSHRRRQCDVGRQRQRCPLAPPPTPATSQPPHSTAAVRVADDSSLNLSLPVLSHSFVTSSLVGELSPPAAPSRAFQWLQSSPAYIHRSYIGETLTVVYAADGGAGVHNLLTSTIIRRIRRIEQAVMNAPGLPDALPRVLYRAGHGQLHTPVHRTQLHVPNHAGHQRRVRRPGQPAHRPHARCHGPANERHERLLRPRLHAAPNVRTSTLISQFTFGLPLPGYADVTDRLGQQRAVLRAWLAATFEPILAEADGQGGVRVLREGGNIVAEEVNAIVMRDLLTVLLSIALVLAYMVWHTRSLFLTVCSLLMMAASFPTRHTRLPSVVRPQQCR